MQLGFVGFGEVGFELSRGFKQEGLDGTIAYDPLANDPQYGGLVKERAKEATVCLLESPLDVAKRSDVIIAAVPGSKAAAAASAVVPVLNAAKVYADVSTSSPKTKQTIAAAILPTGGLFVDVALMDSITQYRHRVPSLVSGNGSDRFIQVMSPYHMCLEKVSDQPGEAIANKLVRSIYMKGLASLGIELLEAASALKVTPRVLKSISDSMNNVTFEDKLNFLVTAGAIHAARQAHEMADAAAMLIEMGIEPLMTEATRKRLQWLADKRLKEKFQGQKPKRWEQVVQAWETSED
jgi:3-hydroxyisobutyrate dehydrogenase-like beta-hydroxyacid dehydrogenase